MTKKKEDYKKTPEPHYYTGNLYGYSARNIVDDFDLSSWTAQAVQYILRAGKKEGSATEQDIQKAINVLHFELDRLYKKSEVKTGGLAQ
jgi:hypothetical protein|tara:strand:+ start:306 stop:572 length:267 start_codon:yes stop_codon:yes gene_type:complete